MNQIEPWKSFTFVGTLLVIALVINHGVGSDDSDEPARGQVAPSSYEPVSSPSVAPAARPPIPAGPTPAEIAEAQRQKFLSRYLASRISPQAGKKTVAVAVLSEDGRLNDSLAVLIANRVKSETLDITTSLFTPEFALDGLFAETFGGSRATLEKLELTRTLDALLLARQTVEYSSNPSLENVLSAHMQLEFQVIPLGARGESKSLALRANGPGFKRSDARFAAQERLVKQIETDARVRTLIIP